mgnify:CR=1 FL=1
MIDRHLTSEKLEEQFLSLPKDIQNAITSNAILDVVGEIGKNRGLHIDQTGVLAEETALLMLGETRLDGFSSRMEESLGVPSNIANAIVQDLNDKIFLPIRASLMTLHEKRATPQAPEDMLATNMTPLSDVAPETSTMKERLAPLGVLNNKHVPAHQRYLKHPRRRQFSIQ